MFSVMGIIFNNKRSSLSTQTADASSAIHDSFFVMPDATVAS